MDPALIPAAIALLILVIVFGIIGIVIAWHDATLGHTQTTYRHLRTLYMSDPDKSRWYLYYNSAAYTLHQGTDKEHDITLGFTTPWGMIAYYFGLYRPETRKQRNTRQATTLLKITEDVRDRAKTHADDELAKARAEIKELRAKLSSSAMSQDKAWRTGDACTLQTVGWNELHNMAAGTATQKENK